MAKNPLRVAIYLTKTILPAHCCELIPLKTSETDNRIVVAGDFTPFWNPPNYHGAQSSFQQKLDRHGEC